MVEFLLPRLSQLEAKQIERLWCLKISLGFWVQSWWFHQHSWYDRDIILHYTWYIYSDTYCMYVYTYRFHPAARWQTKRYWISSPRTGSETTGFAWGGLTANVGKLKSHHFKSPGFAHFNFFGLGCFLRQPILYEINKKQQAYLSISM